MSSYLNVHTIDTDALPEVVVRDWGSYFATTLTFPEVEIILFQTPEQLTELVQQLVKAAAYPKKEG